MTCEIQLNPRVLGVARSATVAINDRTNALRREGQEIFKLGPGQSPFPVPGVVVRELRKHASQNDYLPAQGLTVHAHLDEVHPRSDQTLLLPFDAR